MRWSWALSQDSGTPQALAEAVAALRRERADWTARASRPPHFVERADSGR
jgi:hypothetical protein